MEGVLDMVLLVLVEGGSVVVAVELELLLVLLVVEVGVKGDCTNGSGGGDGDGVASRGGSGGGGIGDRGLGDGDSGGVGGRSVVRGGDMCRSLFLRRRCCPPCTIQIPLPFSFIVHRRKLRQQQLFSVPVFQAFRPNLEAAVGASTRSLPTTSSARDRFGTNIGEGFGSRVGQGFDGDFPEGFGTCWGFRTR